MKLTIEIELEESEANQIRQNSIERVLNTASEVGGLGERFFKRDQDRQLASTSWQDCDDLKPVVVKIWGAVSNAVFLERYRRKAAK